MAAPTEKYSEGFFIPKVTKRAHKKNWPLPPFVLEEGKRIEAQVSAQKLALKKNNNVAVSPLSGDSWFDIPESEAVQ